MFLCYLDPLQENKMPFVLAFVFLLSAIQYPLIGKFCWMFMTYTYVYMYMENMHTSIRERKGNSERRDSLKKVVCCYVHVDVHNSIT